jgi:hypothetical protein
VHLGPATLYLFTKDVITTESKTAKESFKKI